MSIQQLQTFVDKIMEDILSEDKYKLETSTGHLKLKPTPEGELKDGNPHKNMFLNSVLTNQLVADTILECIYEGKWNLKKTQYNVEIFTSELEDDCCTEDFLKRWRMRSLFLKDHLDVVVKHT